MNSLMLSEKNYARAKWLVQIVLPAFTALYVGLAQFYGLPGVEKVAGTVALVTVFLGTVLGLSTRNYNNSDAPYDGDAVITTSPEGKRTVSLELSGDPYEIVEKKAVSFKVRDEQDYAGMDLG